MKRQNVGFGNSLENTVVEANKCTGCGACVVACPFESLEYVDEKPRLKEKCRICGACVKACPQLDWSTSKIERFSFGRSRGPDEKFGVHRRLAIAQASNDEVHGVSQDGGLVTALLLFAFKKRLIDGAVLSGVDAKKPFFPIPKLATSPKQVMQSAGTRYFYSPNVLALSQRHAQKRNLAFVGTPCQIRAVRQMQVHGLNKHVASLRFLIGLMCSECFTYEGLMEELVHKELGIDPNSVRKMNIKGKIIITHDSTDTNISLTKARQHAREACECCDDFSSEFADISIGGLGLNGWSFAITRSEAGDQLFSSAEKEGWLRTRPAEKGEKALALLVKLSNKKRMPRKR